MGKIKLMFVCLVLIVLTAATCAYSADATSWLQKRVCRFTFHGRNSQARAHNPGDWPAGLFLALRALASQAEVPICFEARPGSVDEPIVPVEINARNVTVKVILDKMISQDPRYVYRERLGVIEMFPQGADRDPEDCLNLVIPLFKARHAWNTLFQSLKCEVRIVSLDPKTVVADPWVDPRGGGCGGSYPVLAHPPPGLVEANFENRTVRDILDLLCAKVGNMAWEADFDNPPHWSTDPEDKRTPSPLSCRDLSFRVYQPRKWYYSDTVPLTYSQGLPKNCITCHYHQPCRPK